MTPAETTAARAPFTGWRPWLTNILLLTLGIALFRLSQQLVGEYHHFTIGFSGVSGWSAAIYTAAVVLILTQPVNRATLPLVLAIALAARIPPLLAPPHLSTDIYRYVWDGIVQHAHISPYRYVPGDPALGFLRAPHQDIFAHINRRDYAHTIYPPLAQMLFYLITAVSPTVTAMKLAMVLFEAVTVAALLQMLKGLGRPPEQVLLYAWCPLLVWEIAGAGHLDSAAIAFIALALLARLGRRPIATGLLLGIAVMIKFYPLVLAPALWFRGDYRSGAAWKMAAALAAPVVLGYACYAGVGSRVFGFLGGYAQEEGLETGSRYFLYDLACRAPALHNLPIAIFYLVCVAIFLALTLWALAASRPQAPRRAFLAPAFALAFALMLLFSPHYAWYILWLVPFFALQPNLPVLAYLMGFFYLYTTRYAMPGPGTFFLNKVLYALTLASFAVWLPYHLWAARRARRAAAAPVAAV